MRPHDGAGNFLTAKARATLIGFSAVVLWSLLALFTVGAGAVPVFQLTAMTFAIGGALGAASWIARPGAIVNLKQGWRIWLLGIAGLFGYHVLYFTALKNAPPVEAGLIAYLWPLLIVLMSAMLPGERIGWHHIAGALLGLAGTALIVTRGAGLRFETAYALGYGAAFGCAIVWSGYSVLSRATGRVPTDVVIGFCMATAVLSLILHLALETSVWPQSVTQWLAILGLGLGPVGAAFYAWDHGMKHGDIAVLGASSYLAPLFSTLFLILAGFAPFSVVVLVACLLITGGAVLAAKSMIFTRRSHANGARNRD